jgi:hypothetical protein
LIDATWVERLVNEWCFLSGARAIRMLFGGTVGIGQVIVDGNGKSAWCKETFSERILTIKA